MMPLLMISIIALCVCALFFFVVVSKMDHPRRFRLSAKLPLDISITVEVDGQGGPPTGEAGP